MTDIASPQDTGGELSPAGVEIAASQAHYRSRRAWPAFRIAERNESWTRFDDRIAVKLQAIRDRLTLQGISERTLVRLVAATAFLPSSIAIHTLERLDQDGLLIDAALTLDDNIFSRVLHSRLRFLWRMQMLSRIFSPDRRQFVISALEERLPTEDTDD
jgi:hypothetical protein